MQQYCLQMKYILFMDLINVIYHDLVKNQSNHYQNLYHLLHTYQNVDFFSVGYNQAVDNLYDHQL